jgi:hypothetical protein
LPIVELDDAAAVVVFVESAVAEDEVFVVVDDVPVDDVPVDDVPVDDELAEVFAVLPEV